MAVFVSYRREDGPLVAPLVHGLESRLPGMEVFRDVDDLRLGVNWKDELDHALKDCVVFVPIVGPAWVKEPPNDAEPRDWLAKEIVWALERRLEIIPVNVGLSRPLDSSHLTPAIRPILDRQALTIDSNNWGASMDALAGGVRERVTAAQGLPNLSGTWVYREENQEFRIKQTGDTVGIAVRDPVGRFAPVGRGRVDLDRVQAKIELAPYGTIEIDMQILHGGSVLKGEGYNRLEGKYPLTLVRSR